MTRFALTILAFVLSTGAALADNIRLTNPNALSGELLGRGGLWSLNYDRALDDHLAAGVGFGTVSAQTSIGGVDTDSVTAIPFYANYYFAEEQGSLFGTAGATIFSGTGTGLEAKTGGFDLTNAIVPHVGLGYENRNESGFLFRIAAYALFGGDVTPWGGFTLGFAF